MPNKSRFGKLSTAVELSTACRAISVSQGDHRSFRNELYIILSCKNDFNLTLVFPLCKTFLRTTIEEPRT